MTEERKQELTQLLNEAMKGLQIRYEYGSLPIPIDVYLDCSDTLRSGIPKVSVLFQRLGSLLLL